MNPRLVAAAPKLRMAASTCRRATRRVLLRRVDRSPNVQVTNFREIYNDHISVHIVSMMLSFVKHLNLYRDHQRDRNWQTLVGEQYNNIFLPESTVVIVGVGGIGSETARLCQGARLQG